jgi:hypothetical protein
VPLSDLIAKLMESLLAVIEDRAAEAVLQMDAADTVRNLERYLSRGIILT